MAPLRSTAWLAACLAGLLFPGPAAAQHDARTCGTFEYSYPYNTEELVENHFIVLDCSGDRLRGWYYGTSDDFDPGREGYLPGFFVIEMNDLVATDDTLTFTLSLSADAFFAVPVPLDFRSAADAREASLASWGYITDPPPREYRGGVSEEGLTFEMGRLRRTFVPLPRSP